MLLPTKATTRLTFDGKDITRSSGETYNHYGIIIAQHDKDNVIHVYANEVELPIYIHTDNETQFVIVDKGSIRIEENTTTIADITIEFDDDIHNLQTGVYASSGGLQVLQSLVEGYKTAVMDTSGSSITGRRLGVKGAIGDDVRSLEFKGINARLTSNHNDAEWNPSFAGTENGAYNVAKITAGQHAYIILGNTLVWRDEND